jgi:hypothetical protein
MSGRGHRSEGLETTTRVHPAIIKSASESSCPEPAAMTKVAVLQSNYIPWKGYFDIIHAVDRFIFYDDVQYTKNDWRNRNRIKTSQGLQWLTIPVGSALNRNVEDVEIPDERWQKKHWKSIQQSYSSADHFSSYRGFFEHVYCERHWTNLSELNRYVIEHISRDSLGISAEFEVSSAFSLSGKKSDRLLDLVKQTQADVYVSGPSAQDYLDEAAFRASGIEIEYMDYSGYPEYPQAYPPFVHEVSILDVLFHVGRDAPRFIWNWRERG